MKYLWKDIFKDCASYEDIPHFSPAASYVRNHSNIDRAEIINPNHKSTNRSPRRTLRVAACKCRICNGARVFLECSVKKGEKETAPQKISHSLCPAM